MPTPILSTKFYIPPPRPKRVQRQRLLQQLTEGLAQKLVLISAPAGFGKTTLISEWVAQCAQPIAWLSLDEGENDPGSFLSYLVVAVQAIEATFGERVLAQLQSPQPTPPQTVMRTLLNEIATIPQKFVLGVSTIWGSP
jgi:LuxR family transcriptional regulator, maltose regulon positive regulatory protein